VKRRHWTTNQKKAVWFASI